MRTIVAAIVGVVFLLVPASRLAASDVGKPSAGSHTVFVVRHAEKVADGSRDPDLSEAGNERARRLASMLGDEEFRAAFVTDTKRSEQTALPLADAEGIATSLYKPMDYGALAEAVDMLEQDGSVLVVGHSNTVSGIVEALGGEAVGELSEDEYDNLFIVVREGGEHVRTVRLRL